MRIEGLTAEIKIPVADLSLNTAFKKKFKVFLKDFQHPLPLKSVLIITPRDRFCDVQTNNRNHIRKIGAVEISRAAGRTADLLV